MMPLWTICLKELREFLRDRSTLLTVLVYTPLLTPILILGLLTLAEAWTSRQIDKPLEIAIVGAERAPRLVAWLAGQGIGHKPVADPDAAIRSQDAEVYLRIGDDYRRQWQAGAPALVELVHDSSRRDAGIAVQRLEKALHAYAAQVGALRLLARGIDPGVASPLAVAHKDLATPEAKRSMVMAMLPYLFILSAFLGGAALVIDATAGERERQSLEPLLATPVARGTIVSAKMAAAAVVGLASLSLTLLALKLGASLTPGIARSMDVSLSTIAKILLILLPMVFTGTTMLTWIAAGAKSVKEAQSHLAILMLLPLVPTMVLLVSPIKDQLWQFAVPFLAQNQLLLKVLRAEAIGPAQWLIYTGCSFTVVLALWQLARVRYRRERLAIAT